MGFLYSSVCSLLFCKCSLEKIRTTERVSSQAGSPPLASSCRWQAVNFFQNTALFVTVLYVLDSKTRNCFQLHPFHDPILSLRSLFPYYYLLLFCAQSCPTLWRSMALLCPWASPGKNAGVGCHLLLQGIFLTQRSNLSLLCDKQILYHECYLPRTAYYPLIDSFQSIVSLFNEWRLILNTLWGYCLDFWKDFLLFLVLTMFLASH